MSSRITIKIENTKGVTVTQCGSFHNNFNPKTKCCHCGHEWVRTDDKDRSCKKCADK